MNLQISLVVTGCIFSLQFFASYQNFSQPRDIIIKAIEAHGGQANITKPRLGIIKAKNTDPFVEGSIEETFDLPKRWKRVTVSIFEKQKKIGVNLMLDGKFWEWEEGGEVRQTKNESGATAYFEILTGLLELMEEKVELKPLKEITKEGQSSVGFWAGWKEKAGEYYFDKKTGLLAQSNIKWQPEVGKEFDVQTIFHEYKDFDGVKLPFRRTFYIKGGNFKEFILLTDLKITEINLLDNIPSKVFSIPGKK